jgi:hypothetical protein
MRLLYELINGLGDNLELILVCSFLAVAIFTALILASL